MLENLLTKLLADAGACDLYAPPPIEISGQGRLPSCFAVSDLAANSICMAAMGVAAVCAQRAGAVNSIAVDKTLAGHWFSQTLYPVGWSVPPLWDDVAGDYAAQDGWIRLHTNAPHHRQAAISVLGCADNAEAVKRAVSDWSADALETAIVGNGGCAAKMYSRREWLDHPQGQSVAGEPLAHWSMVHQGTIRKLSGKFAGPLAGIRVLDLTRVLAGPVCTRLLGGFGAQVLRIDPIGLWDDSANAPEMSLGKRCAGLDLRAAEHRQTFLGLLEHADIFVHGYRPGALDAMGLGNEQCRKINPELIVVSLDAYGWSGPWAGRRGFDSLVQMSSGIAEAGMRWRQADRPGPLPVQALDHATGYLMAACAGFALAERLRSGKIWEARLSLAKTADFLFDYPSVAEEATPDAPDRSLFAANLEQTPWGAARRLRPPLKVGPWAADWQIAAHTLRSDSPEWTSERPKTMARESVSDRP